MIIDKNISNFKHLFFIIFFFLTLTLSLNAQNQLKIDSLLNVLGTTKQDTVKVFAYADLCDAYRRSNIDTAMYFGNAGLTLAIKTNFKNGMSVCYNKIGKLFEAQCNYPAALEYYQKALEIREGIGNKKEIATSFNNIGAIYKNQGNYPKALDYHQKSLKIFEELGDKQEISNC